MLLFFFCIQLFLHLCFEEGISCSDVNHLSFAQKLVGGISSLNLCSRNQAREEKVDPGQQCEFHLRFFFCAIALEHI